MYRASTTEEEQIYLKHGAPAKIAALMAGTFGLSSWSPPERSVSKRESMARRSLDAHYLGLDMLLLDRFEGALEYFEIAERWAVAENYQPNVSIAGLILAHLPVIHQTLQKSHIIIDNLRCREGMPPLKHYLLQ